MFLKFAGDAVFMANGVFLENNSCIRYKQKEAVYVTVFPLNPALLPYTVKFTGCSAFPDSGLVTVVALSKDKYLDFGAVPGAVFFHLPAEGRAEEFGA